MGKDSKLKQIIKEAFDGVINDISTDNTMGGNPNIDAVVELLENYDWETEQVNGNLIYAHLQNDNDLEIIVEVSNIGAILKELHYKDSDGYGMDSSLCIDIKQIIDKLAEVDF